MSDIYFDNAATSPMRPEVLQAMSVFFTERCGNPSSLHMPGQRAKRAVEESRYVLATSLGADPQEIVFTSGGTESNNLAIHGVARSLRSRGRHILTSSIEHNAVLGVCRSLEEDGFEVTYLPVDGSGILDVSSLRDAVRTDTILVSVMLANNEVGTIQPIKEVASITRERSILLHTDGCQAVGKMPVHVHDLGVDLLSLAAHKFHGPQGQGALFVKRGTRIKPLFQGGHQERMLRPGTENVPGIVGMAAAIRLASEDLVSDSLRVRGLRDLLERGVRERVSGVSFNGHRDKRIPQISNMSFASVEGEALLLALDMRSISVSTGSACNAGSTEPSHVLQAMGLDPSTARGGLRFSLGRQNTDAEVNAVIEALAEIVTQLRSL